MPRKTGSLSVVYSTPFGFCFRVIENEKPLNLEKTTYSVLSVLLFFYALTPKVKTRLEAFLFYLMNQINLTTFTFFSGSHEMQKIITQTKKKKFRGFYKKNRGFLRF